MSPLLVVSIVIRIAANVWAMAWSLVVLRRLRDWRIACLTALIVLMTLRESLTLLGKRESGVLSVVSGAGEQPGIVLSIAVFVAIPFLARMLIERKRAEDSLRQSEAKFRVLTQTIPSVIFIFQNSKVVYANSFAETHSGYSEQELRSMDFWEMVHPDHRQSAKERGLARLRGEPVPSRYELKLITKSGEERWVDFGASFLEFEGKPSVLGTAFDITDRKRAEELLRKAHDWLQHVLLCSPATIYLLRVQGKRLTAEWVSENITGLTGYEQSEALSGGWWAEHLHPDDRERALASLPQVLADDRLVFEYRFEHKNGRYLWVHDELRLLRDESGKPAEVIGSWMDVTDRREAEAALRDSEARFRTLVSSMDDIVFTVDREQRYSGVFGRWYDKFGVDREGIIGRTASDLFGIQAGSIHEEPNARSLAGEQVVYEWSTAINGECRHFQTSLSPIRDQNLEVTGLVGVGRDTTDHKQAEEALRASEERYRDLVENARDIIYSHDLKGNYTSVNKAVEQITGYSCEEALARNFEQTVAPEYVETARRMIAAKLAGQKETVYDLEIIAKDGRRITVEVNTRLVRQDNVPIGIQGIARDVTERKRAADLLRRQAAQLAALHEIELEISAESDLSRILEVVTRRAAELLNASHCSTFIRERDDATLTLVASLESKFIGLRLEGAEGLAGRALITGESQWIDDYSKWQGRARVFDAEDFGPAIAAPLKWQQTVIGATSLSRQRGEPLFTRDDSRLLEQLAAVAAIAIHQATLFDEVQENQNRLQILSRRLIDAQEAERKRLARELHDQIGQALMAVQISLQSLPSSCDPRSGSPLDDRLTIIDDALQQVHDLSLGLRPSLLDDLGLEAALRWYVDRVAGRAGLVKRFKADALEGRLAPQLETACFRIAQEALTNVLRHARAATVSVQVTQRNSELQLVVRDDGVGFDVRTAMGRTGPNASLGLQGMQERAAALGGVVDISSHPGRGAEVHVSFPLTLPHSTL